MEKLLETAKKFFPAASSLMRAVEVLSIGGLTMREPVLGAFEARIKGKESPTLVERRMLTAVAWMGLLAVPATFQLIVWSPNQRSPAWGAEIRNGPLLASTVTWVSAKAVPPRLARAVTRKCMVRFVVGSFSPGVEL